MAEANHIACAANRTFNQASVRSMADLIEAHSEAARHWDAALTVKWDIEDKLGEEDKEYPYRAPMAVYPDGEFASGWYEYTAFRKDEIVEKIREKHANIKKIHCSDWVERMFGEPVAAREAAIDRSEERALKALDDLDAQIQARRENSGLIAAESVCELARKREERARLDLLLRAPVTEDEALLKREYISTASAFRDCIPDDSFVALMIDRLSTLQR